MLDQLLGMFAIAGGVVLLVSSILIANWICKPKEDET